MSSRAQFLSVSIERLSCFAVICCLVSGDPVSAQTSAKDLADTKTAEANAQKAQAEAQLAAVKAMLGEVPASGYSGAVELGTAAGSAEAVLLSAVAVNDAAAEFATRISADLPNAKKFALTSSAAVPDFQMLTAFYVQLEAFRSAYALAQATASVPEQKPKAEVVEAAAIGLGLDAINKLLAFAKTDYKFVGFDMTGSSDAMLLSALARCMRKPDVTVEFPSVYLGTLAAPNPVLAETSKIGQWSYNARKSIKHFEAEQATVEKALAAAPNDQGLKDRLEQSKDALAVWKAVSESIDAWVSRVSATDGNGNVPLATIIRQSALKQKLDSGACLVVVQLHKLVGTGYTKKNIWSSLGRNPFLVAGGAVAGYVAFDGQSGEVKSSMFLPVHGGYHSISDVVEVVEHAFH